MHPPSRRLLWFFVVWFQASKLRLLAFPSRFFLVTGSQHGPKDHVETILTCD